MLNSTTSFLRQYRLTQASDYQLLFDRAKKRYSRHFVILYADTGQQTARLGLAISKKRMKRAVERNWVKRMVRESFRHQRAQLPTVDIVVMMRKEARKGDTPLVKLDLRNELDKQWQRLKKASFS